MNCTGPKCRRVAIARGLCVGHYAQRRRKRPLRPLGESGLPVHATRRQKQVIRLLMTDASIREMRLALKIASTKGVYDHIDLLIRKGHVMRRRHKFASRPWVVTASGLAEVGLKRCASCAGAGHVRMMVYHP